MNMISPRPVAMGPVTALRGGDPGSRYVMRKTTRDHGEISLYGLIGSDWFGEGNSAKNFAKDLKDLGNVRTIDLRINSEGGDVFTGKAMYSLLTEHAAKVVTHVDGVAASAASFVAMAGNEIRVAEGGFVMIHNCWTTTSGDSAKHRRMAELLDSVNASVRDVYVARTGNTAEDITAWMDEETWMNGKDAVKRGFAEVVVENLSVAASVADPSRFRNLPSALKPNRRRAAAAVAAMRT